MDTRHLSRSFFSGEEYCVNEDSQKVEPSGFDEYMNLVLDEAEEVSIKKKTRKPLGRILLKGESEEEHLHELVGADKKNCNLCSGDCFDQC
ncbi:small nuclear ribonucleoprotein E [Tanacetum coccineum]